MATYLVSYDLVGTDPESENYARLRETLEAFDDYAEVRGEAAWQDVRGADQWFRQALAD
ncbi:MAG TPA: hypothetical protein VKG38_17890 [Solirubrobacteraceae bacterium]|nr:hypothetical protein [Solirubrobacteraceae bacterium]